MGSNFQASNSFDYWPTTRLIALREDVGFIVKCLSLAQWHLRPSYSELVNLNVLAVLVKRSTTTTRTTPVCPLPLCGLKGHKTVRSQKCKHNKKNPNYVGDEAVDDLNNKPAATNNTAVDTVVSTLDNETAQASRDAEECDVMDSQPLDDSSASDAFWSAEEHNDEISDSDDNTQLGML